MPGAADVSKSASWSFLRSPKWIVSHVLVLALVLAMIAAGIWQINRHGERADRNDLVRARSELTAVDIASVAPAGSDASVGEIEQFRRVSATGTFRTEDEVLIRNRTFDGAPGWWVLTPFVLEDGSAVAVNRGWIPAGFESEEPRPGTEPPRGTVTIVGFVQPARQAEGFQVADPAEGVLTSLARPDIARLAQQLDYPLSPVVFQLAPDGFGERESDELPFTLGLPALDAGPHASYAAQWFIFTTIALLGYPLILRRVSRGQAESHPDDEPA